MNVRNLLASPCGLLTVAAIAALAPGAQAQSTQVVFDLETDTVPSIGGISIPNEFVTNVRPRVFIDDDGNWYATVNPAGSALSVVVRNGELFLGGDTANFEGAGAMGVEDDGSVTLNRSSYDSSTSPATQNTEVLSWDGTSMRTVITSGVPLTGVSGLPVGSTLAAVSAIEVYGDQGLLCFATVESPGGEITSGLILTLGLDSQGNVNSGALQTGFFLAPPDGPGNEIQALRQYVGNSSGEFMYGALVQPGSHRQVFRNGQVEFTYLQVLDGVTLGQVPVESTLDYREDGSWLAVLRGLVANSCSFPDLDPCLDGIIVRNGQTFAKAGDILPGFGLVRSIHWDNARLLNGGFVAWVHEDSEGPSFANDSYVIEGTRAFSEGDLRFDDRIAKDLLRSPFSASPSGRYMIAKVDLQPGDAIVTVDLLGTPNTPCTQEPDQLAPNHDCSNAFDLGLIDDPQSFAALIAEESAPDFLRMTIPAQSDVIIEVTTNHDAADLDIFIHSGDCSAPFPLGSDTLPVDDLCLVWPNPTDLPLEVVLEIRVASTSPFACGAYDLEVSQQARPLACSLAIEEDPFEPNGSMGQGTPLVPGTYSGLYLNGGSDRDYFLFEIEPGETLLCTAEIATMPTFSPSLIGRIVRRPVFDNEPKEVVVSSSLTNFGSPLELQQTNNSQETVYWAVQMSWLTNSASSGCTLYDMEIEILPDAGWVSYCGPANVNSRGKASRIVPTGSSSLSAADLVLTATDLPAEQFGYFLASPDQGFAPLVGGSAGDLCLGGAIGRYSDQVQSSGASGTIVLQPDTDMIPTPTGTVAVQVGQTWNFQAWHRDQDQGPTSNLTDAVSVTFQN